MSDLTLLQIKAIIFSMNTFGGNVFFITRDENLYARASYMCPKRKRHVSVERKVDGSKKKAKAKVIRAIEEKLNPAPSSQIKTFNQLADYYIENHAFPAEFVDDIKVAGMKSYRNARSDIKQLRKEFGRLILRSITKDKISSYRGKLLKRKVKRVDRITGETYYKPATHSLPNHQLRTLRAMLDVARENNWLDKTPSFKNLIPSSLENTRLEIPSRFEFQSILDACTGRRQHLRAIVLFSADTGARPVEMFNLKWTAIDFLKRVVTLRSDKGKKRTFRDITLTDRVYDELKTLNENKINEFVFGGIRSVKHSWHTIQRMANVPHLDFYTLRHLFASRIVANNPEISIFELR